MSFFSKLFSSKTEAVTNDYKWLATDFHSHLIPGIDDGAKTLADSIALIKGLQSLGFNKVITSPHIMTDGYNNSSSDILRGRDLVREELVKQKIDIPFDAISEYYLDETIFDKIKKRDLLTTGDNYVLVELSYFNKSHSTNTYFFELKGAGYKVILAHPERYPYFHSNSLEMYQELIDAGVLLQLNLSSLTGVYGKGAKAIAENLIEKGMIHFAATDTHNIRHLSYIKGALDFPAMQKLVKLPLLNKVL